MRRRWRLVVVIVAAVVGVVAATIAAIAVNVATSSNVTWWPSWLPSINDNYLRWLAGSMAAVAGSGLFGWWAQRWYERGLVPLVPVPQRPDSWVVDRPEELTEIVAALRRRHGGTVGVTTALHGAGGFGKTTVARLVRCDRRVLRRFGARVFWVTLGRDARRGALVEKVNDLVRQIDPALAQPFTDVRQAAEHLAAVLASGPRRLVILDDVWFDDQLTAFPVAGKCARLVTTRLLSLVAGQAVPVRVDQMSAEQARRVLTADLLQPLPIAVVDALIEETGRWPLLLRLTNRNMVDQTRADTNATEVARDLLRQLRRDGALSVAGRPTGVGAEELDVNDPDQRNKAVAATIEASTGLLTQDEHARFAEVAIFVEDETIPVPLVAALWQSTGGLSQTQTRVLCARLADLALMNLTATDTGGMMSLHDVVRDYLYGQLGKTRATRLHRALLDAVAADLPTAAAPESAEGKQVVAWWELPEAARYLWDHVIEHLLAAGRGGDADTLVTDLRWVEAHLQLSGPVAPFADLCLIDTARAARLRRLIGQIAHLLTPTDPHIPASTSSTAEWSTTRIGVHRLEPWPNVEGYPG